MPRLLCRMLLGSALFLVYLLTGCGSGSQSLRGGTGGLSIAVQRPTAKSRYIPLVAKCVKVEVSNAAGWKAESIAPFAASGSTTLHVSEVPTGAVTVNFTAYDNYQQTATGILITGNLVASAEVTATVEGGKDTTVGANFSSLELFPLKVGYELYHRAYIGTLTASTAFTSHHMKITAVDTSGSLPIWTLTEYNTNSGTVYDDTKMQSTGAGLVALSDTMNGGSYTSTYAPAKMLVPNIGQNSYSQTYANTFTSAGSAPSSSSVSQTFTWLDNEDVTVPAGLFAMCSKLQLHAVINSYTTEDSILWLLPGIGPVKETNTRTTNMPGSPTPYVDTTTSEAVYISDGITAYGALPKRR